MMSLLLTCTVLLGFLLSCWTALALLKTSSWTPQGQLSSGVTSYKAELTCRSKLDCVVSCLKYTHCSRVAFRQSTSSCYLLPTSQSGQAEGDVIVIENTDPLCTVSEAPIANAKVTWIHTLTSLDGDVTGCYPAHVWTTSDVNVNCSADGVWTVGGECKQKYWMNPVVMTHYFLPLTPRIGWKLCTTGTPQADATKLSLNLFDASDDRPFVIEFRFYANETRLFSHMGGNYVNGETVMSPAFPLARSVPFLLELIATSENSLNVYVNGSFFYTRALPTSVSTLSTAIYYHDVTPHDLDLWCHQAN